nr:capsid protein [Goose astrovirus]
MADRAVAPREKVTKKVTKVVTVKKKHPKKKPKQKVYKPQKLPMKAERKLEKEVKGLKKRVAGPPVNDKMTTTITLGQITGNSTDTLDRKHKYFTNPLMMKNQENGQTATPLSIRASQYNLWRIRKLHIRLVPLAGRANILGSVVFLDIEQEANTAGPESIDTIKARPHLELPIGSKHLWRVQPRLMQGPRQGWWNVDPGDSPTDSLGPAINMWTYLKTVNALSTRAQAPQVPYTSALFLVEATVTYEFSNYGPKPGLSLMTSETLSASGKTATLVNTQDGALALTVSGALQRFLDEKEQHRRVSNAQTSGVGEVFWAVSTEVVETVASALGGWGWLLKGGWFVIRKLFGAASNSGSTYLIYSSVSDAQIDSRIYQTVPTNTPLQLAANTVKLVQLTQPNVNTTGQGTTVLSRDADYLPLPVAPMQVTPSLVYNFQGERQSTTESCSFLVFGIPQAESRSRYNANITFNVGYRGRTSTSFTLGTHNWWAVMTLSQTGVLFAPPAVGTGVCNTLATAIQHLNPELETAVLRVNTSTTSTGGLITELRNRLNIADGDYVISMGDPQGNRSALYFRNSDQKWVWLWAGDTDPGETFQSFKMPVLINWSVSDSQGQYNARVRMVQYANAQQQTLTDPEEDDDPLSDVTSLFDPTAEDETDFHLAVSLKTSDYLKEEAEYWKAKAQALLMEKALSAPQAGAVRFEKGGHE